MATKRKNPADALKLVIAAVDSLDVNGKQWVLQSAASLWNVTLQLPAAIGGGSDVARVGAANASRTLGGSDVDAAIANNDPRSFVRLKKPTTDVERVACLGYYLLKTTRQPGFSRKDITKAHVDSGGSAINMTRALDNATRQSKYLSNRGPREKQLTTLGEDVAEALPSREGVAAAEEAAKSIRKRKGKRKARKAKKG